MGWLMVLAAVVALAAAPAEAQEGCEVPAAPSWSPVEAAVWQQLCAGQPFDFNGEAENLDPHQPDGWDETRMLSSAFVEQLLEEPYAGTIDRHGIFLVGAWFPDGLDLREATIGFPLRCQSCRIAGMQARGAVIDGDLDLRGAAIEGDLSLLGADLRSDLVLSSGAVVSGTLTADRLTVAGSVFLRDGSKFTDIRLLGAGIGGDLDVNGGSVVSGTLNADGLTVADSVFLCNGSTFTDIRLVRAGIGSNLEVNNGSVVSGALIADGLMVAGSALLRDGSTFTDIRLVGADIGSNLEVNNGSVVSGALIADGLTVAGAVFLRDGSRFTYVRLLGAAIDGDLDVGGGSVVSGTLNAEGLTVAGSVVLNDGSQFNTVVLPGAEVGGFVGLEGARWEPGGSLDLRQAHAGGVVTDERAESLPDRLKLDGFAFDRWVQPDPRGLGTGWFIDNWLGRQGEFSPSPYTQLAAVMDESGHPTIAADLRYHRSDEERKAISWFRPERWGRLLHGLVLGYGYRPWWALGWLFAAWAAGFLVLWLHVDGRRVVRSEWSVGQAALYSLDRLVPAISLADPDELPDRTRAQRVWSNAQVLTGWLLTLFIVGWLGSLLV